MSPQVLCRVGALFRSSGVASTSLEGSAPNNRGLDADGIADAAGPGAGACKLPVGGWPQRSLASVDPGSTESSLVQAVVQLPAAWQSAGAAQISGGCGDWPRTRAGRAMIIISWLLSGLSFVEIARALSFELYEV